MMPNSDLKVLGEKVRKERKLAGLTQEQLRFLYKGIIINHNKNRASLH